MACALVHARDIDKMHTCHACICIKLCYGMYSGPMLHVTHT